MTQEQLQSIQDTLKTAIGTAGAIATVIRPEAAVFIALGQVVAKAAPELYAQVAAWIEKAEPTEAELAKLADDIAALLKPEEL